MKEKIKVSKEQFAEALYYHWFLKVWNDKEIKKTAEELDFKIRNDNDYSKIYKELFFLNMWIVIYTCEKVFEDENKRNKYLDFFHHFVYGRVTEGRETNFGNWIKTITAKYIEYNKAMETKHPSTPLWVLAELINKNLFGEIEVSAILQTEIITQVALSIQHLREAIKYYDIE